MKYAQRFFVVASLFFILPAWSASRADTLPGWYVSYYDVYGDSTYFVKSCVHFGADGEYELYLAIDSYKSLEAGKWDLRADTLILVTTWVFSQFPQIPLCTIGARGEDPIPYADTFSLRGNQVWNSYYKEGRSLYRWNPGQHRSDSVSLVGDAMYAQFTGFNFDSSKVQPVTYYSWMGDEDCELLTLKKNGKFVLKDNRLLESKINLTRRVKGKWEMRNDTLILNVRKTHLYGDVIEENPPRRYLFLLQKGRLQSLDEPGEPERPLYPVQRKLYRRLKKEF